MALTLTAEHETPVEAVKLTLTGAAAGTATVRIWRTGPSGVVAYVRGFGLPLGGTYSAGMVVRDYEAPIGVPLTYQARGVNAAGADLELSATVSFTLPDDGCDDTWLTDLARPTNTQQVTVESLDELAYLVPSGVHDILGRRTPIVSSDVANSPTFELGFLTDTDDERERARATLGNGVPVLLRTPPANGIGNLYFAVTAWREQRIVKAAREPARRFLATCVQVERPDTTLYLPLAPATYQHVKDTFATYAELLAGRTSYDAMLYDWEGDEPADLVPWPPTDV